MPEGVEVKLSAECIKPLVDNKLIGKITISNTGRYAQKVPEGYDEFNNSFRELQEIVYMVSPIRIQDIATKGKFMYWTFSNSWYMFCTFGMTGQWSPQSGKHPCLHFRLHDPVTHKISEIYFNDQRHFGTIKFVHGKDKLDKKLYELGWDPLTQELERLRHFVIGTVKATSKPIGQILMDQKVFAGVGNYIRAEALYQSKISPWRLGSTLSDTEIISLCQSLIAVMQESYKYQGATIQTYTTVYGEEGKYSSCFKVYGQKQDPLGNPIIKETTPEGRTIHWCPTIQV